MCRVQTSQCIKARVSAARNTVSPTISSIGFRPTAARSFSWVFMPMAAIETTSTSARGRCRPWPCRRGSQPVLLIATSSAKPTANHGSSGGRAPPASPAWRRESSDGEDDHRQQHRHPHQLDHGGDVAGLLRHAVAGADHLGHVVDRRRRGTCRPRAASSPSARRSSGRRSSPASTAPTRRSR